MKSVRRSSFRSIFGGKFKELALTKCCWPCWKEHYCSNSTKQLQEVSVEQKKKKNRKWTLMTTSFTYSSFTIFLQAIDALFSCRLFQTEEINHKFSQMTLIQVKIRYFCKKKWNANTTSLIFYSYSVARSPTLGYNVLHLTTANITCWWSHLLINGKHLFVTLKYFLRLITLVKKSPVCTFCTYFIHLLTFAVLNFTFLSFNLSCNVTFSVKFSLIVEMLYAVFFVAYALIGFIIYNSFVTTHPERIENILQQMLKEVYLYDCEVEIPNEKGDAGPDVIINKVEIPVTKIYEAPSVSQSVKKFASCLNLHQLRKSQSAIEFSRRSSRILLQRRLSQAWVGGFWHIKIYEEVA